MAAIDRLPPPPRNELFSRASETGEGGREGEKKERESLARHSTHSLKRFIRSMAAEQTLSSAHFERYSFYVLSMERGEEDSYNRPSRGEGGGRKEKRKRSRDRIFL